MLDWTGLDWTGILDLYIERVAFRVHWKTYRHVVPILITFCKFLPHSQSCTCFQTVHIFMCYEEALVCK